jgi:hypothetical protein
MVPRIGDKIKYKDKKCIVVAIIPRQEIPEKYSEEIEKKVAELWPPSKTNVSSPQYGLNLETVKPSLYNRYVVATYPDKYLWTTKILLLTKKELRNGCLG